MKQKSDWGSCSVQDKVGLLPDKPGCYLFKDRQGVIIYVGKAKSLKKRVSSYFSSRMLDPKTQALISSIVDVDFIVTNSEVEALLLEETLIKRHQPKYNIDLKDSKRYAFIQVTNEPFPRLVTARKKEGNGIFIGPFVSGFDRLRIMQAINRACKLRTCKKLPKRACLRFHVGLCSAPCIGKISEEEYRKSVRLAESILRGDVKKLLPKLEVEMKEHARALRFEKAMLIRDQIAAVHALEERQVMQRATPYDEDIVNFVVDEGVVHLALFHVHKGTLTGKQSFEFAYKDSFLEEFLVQYYSEARVPKVLVVPQRVGGALEEYLSRKRGGKVIVSVPRAGEKKVLLGLVRKNIELSVFRNKKALEALQKELSLGEVPSVIECFDISHMSGASTVGSMVHFRFGLPDKSQYRRFRIRSVEGVDDVRSIAEVVKRRYARLKKEAAALPNLIVIDGGKAQLGAALASLKELGLRVPVVGLAKRYEEVYVPGLRNPLRLERRSEALKLLQRVRDEAHRFAHAYNALLRKKALVGSGTSRTTPKKAVVSRKKTKNKSVLKKTGDEIS